ncbi:hypothetical protein HanRHA438_Chr05g0238391 [Helianthus annuus]|nr:hypothetical protein HanHA89_Chr05g0202481 [Helianthus annuus]KAJ0920170.1 hypothetical protein HanRHA438_Chr05g0238391 [Helianthus annuus]
MLILRFFGRSAKAKSSMCFCMPFRPSFARAVLNKELMVSVDVDVDEGEISDLASVEEISAEDFSAKTPVDDCSNECSKQQMQQQKKVWTMQDLVKHQNKYQMSRNYAPGLYNFAWAQAVQNKPLDDYLKNLNTRSGGGDVNVDVDKQLMQLNGNGDGDNVGVKEEKIVVFISGDDGDSEKEEGELEEGEIDLDVEVVGKQGAGGDVEKWINVIWMGLESKCDKKVADHQQVKPSSHATNYSNGQPYAHLSNSIDSDDTDSISYEDIGGESWQLLEENVQAIKQISANFSSGA